MNLIWHPQSPRSNDAGPRDQAIDTALVEAFNDAGDLLGYVKASFTTPELIAARVPTPLDYQFNCRGWCRSDDSTLAETWYHAHWYAQVTPPSYTGRLGALSVSDAPDDETAQAELDAIGERFREERELWIGYFSVPFIAYSHVEEPYRRTGLGTAMYLEMAGRFAELGLPLRASGLQSDSAEALWASFVNSDTIPTGSITLTSYGNREVVTYPTLDLTRVLQAA